MKKLLLVLAVSAAFVACNNAAESSESKVDSAVTATVDSAKSVIDSTANAAKDTIKAKADSLKK